MQESSDRLKDQRQRIKSSNKSIHHLGWVWFVIGLIFATFVGGAVRVLLSPRQVKTWIETQFAHQNLPFQLHFENTEFQLSDGFRPSFGLVINNVTLNPLETCKVPVQIKIDQAFFPLRIMSLFRQEPVRLGQILVNSVEISNVRSSCPQISEKTITKSTEDLTRIERMKAVLAEKSKPLANLKTREFFSHHWSHILAASLQKLDGMKIGRIHILDFDRPFNDINLSQVEFETDSAQELVSLHFETQFDGVLFETLGSQKIKIDLIGRSQDLSLRIYAPVREGRINLKSVVKAADLTHTGDFNLDFIPAHSLVEILKELKIVTDPISLKRAWLNGRGSWSGDFSEAPLVRSLDVEQIELSGDAGSLKLGKLNLKSSTAGVQFLPFEVKADDFSFRYLIEALGRKGYTGVISDFGTLSGVLSVENPDLISFRGQIENAGVFFSRQNSRAIQKILSIQGGLEYSNQRVSGILRQIEMENGKFVGSMTFNLDRNFRNGLFQVKVEELAFDPQIQELMVGKELGPISLLGSGEIEKGEIKAWSGEVASPFVKGFDWSLQKPRIKVEYLNQKTTLGFRLSDVHLGIESEARKGFQPIVDVAIGEGSLEPLHFDLVSGQVTVMPQQFEWTNWTANSKRSQIVLGGKGLWNSGILEGLITIDTRRKKSVPFVLSGQGAQLRLTPQVK